jgi:hypothetical protein
MDFLLYRLNYEHKPNLFQETLQNDGQLIEVLRNATDPAGDVVKSRTTSGYQWSLREFHLESADDSDGRTCVVLTLARSSLYRAGVMVTDSGFENTISTSSPALAERIIIMLDLKRHLFAVEYNSALMQSDTWRKELERILTRSSHAKDFATKILLIPVPSREELEVRLRKFEKITRVQLTLSLPNPDINSTYERLYREMVEGDVQQLKQDMSNPNGLRLEKSSLPNASLNMAMNGYKRGQIKIRGTSNGKPESITIGDEVTRVEVYGVREFAEGISQGSDDPKVKRAMRAIVKKLDEVLLEPIDGDE